MSRPNWATVFAWAFCWPLLIAMYLYDHWKRFCRWLDQPPLRSHTRQPNSPAARYQKANPRPRASKLETLSNGTGRADLAGDKPPGSLQKGK